MAECELWCTPDDLTCDKAKYDETQIEEAILGASQDLGRFSFYQYGICTYFVQPGTPKCSSPHQDKYSSDYALTPELLVGSPIQEIVEIASFDENKTKTVLDSEDVWFEYGTIFFPETFEFPTQKRGPIGGKNTWHIELKAGNPIPVAGKNAAVAIAMHTLQSGDKDCKVDPRLRMVARQGAEWNLMPADNLITNIPEVAYFLNNYCEKRGWSGARSALNGTSQLVK